MRKKVSPKRVKFELKTEPGSKVFLAGSFNYWDSSQIKLSDKKNDGAYGVSILLAPGRHEYKFVVNGNWITDPNCRESVVNDQGSANSVVNVNA